MEASDQIHSSQSLQLASDTTPNLSPRSSSDEEEHDNETLRLLRMDKLSKVDGQNSVFDDEERVSSPLDGQDSGLHGLTLYEKKCVLINREIDAHGMGKYQWWIWGLCGFGYLLDLLWAQAFGLVLSPIQQEFGFSNAQSGDISVAFSSGLTAGAFVWGFLVDIIGRWWAFNLTAFFSSIFGLCLGVPDSYTSFLVLTAFVGFGVGGNIPIDTTICLEFIPQNRRFLLALLSIFQPIGVVITSVIAYGFIPQHSCKPDFTTSNPLPSCRNVAAGTPCCSKAQNMGYRYLLFTIGGITLFVFFMRFIVFRFQESPKFLVFRGQDDKAIKVLDYVAKFNGVQNNITLEQFERLTQEHESIMSASSGKALLGSALKRTWRQKGLFELERYKLLFSNWQVSRLTILIWLTYICDFWGFTVAGTYLPTILAKKGGQIDVSLRQTYRNYIYIYLPGIVGVLIGAFMYNVPAIGRKWTMVLSSGLMGASIFIFSTVNTQAANVGLNLMEYFFQSMFNAVLYGWTPEVFPAPIRGTACGIASFWGRLFGIVSPLIAQHLYARSEGGDINAVLYLAGGVTLGCVIWISLLPNKLVGAQSM
ncbi:MFS general substrate transporter [Microthyrium microscopicum]|uniref:MFS general substrate transporter n=1 Tax=Microthyrium microscopicum TaxID=703497 RepID=A0A6A6UN13_9PEZI|nr:MFS general substrate transporter [Microthyrium microscopicum]